jgi:RNA polymerase sigma factor (sigma-70 family)
MGKEEAFIEALEPRLRDIYSYLRRLRVDAASADDLAQETILAAWQNLPSLRDHGKLRSWLYAIAHRLYLRHARIIGRKAHAELVEEAAGTTER